MAADEQDIMAGWRGDPSSVVVSICCATYNHAAYIGRAIDSFLEQETDFPFEILVHDDASNDGTADIVRAYAERYPRIVRTVLQTENQYSKKPTIVPRFLFPLVRGRYVAMCEGDDHWCSPEKLARQVGRLERHRDVDLCYHPVLRSGHEGQAGRVVGRHFRDERLIERDRILLGGGSFCRTPSIMIRSSVLDDIRACTAEAPFGDYFIQIIASLRGGAVYLPTPMAVYRRGHAGSWSAGVRSAQRLQQREDRIPLPFEWLYAHCDEVVRPVLESCEADEYARIGKQYLLLRDFEGAGRVLVKAAETAPSRTRLRRFLLWASQGAFRTSAALALVRLVGFHRLARD